MQGLIQVPQEVLQGFESHRQPDQLRRHPAARQLVLAQLLVRGGGGMNDQAPRVAHVGEMGEQPERVDEPPAGGPAVAVRGLEAEREDRTGPSAEVLLRESLEKAVTGLTVEITLAELK